jgi:hypothetical protein
VITSHRRECGVRKEARTLTEMKWFRIGSSSGFKRLSGSIKSDNLMTAELILAFSRKTQQILATWGLSNLTT